MNINIVFFEGRIEFFWKFFVKKEMTIEEDGDMATIRVGIDREAEREKN